MRRMLEMWTRGAKPKVEDACEKDMAEAGHGGIRSTAIPATPDDGTSQG